MFVCIFFLGKGLNTYKGRGAYVGWGPIMSWSISRLGSNDIKLDQNDIKRYEAYLTNLTTNTVVRKRSGILMTIG